MVWNSCTYNNSSSLPPFLKPIEFFLERKSIWSVCVVASADCSPFSFLFWAHGETSCEIIYGPLEYHRETHGWDFSFGLGRYRDEYISGLKLPVYGLILRYTTFWSLLTVEWIYLIFRILPSKTDWEWIMNCDCFLSNFTFPPFIFLGLVNKLRIDSLTCLTPSYAFRVQAGLHHSGSVLLLDAISLYLEWMSGVDWRPAIPAWATCLWWRNKQWGWEHCCSADWSGLMLTLWLWSLLCTSCMPINKGDNLSQSVALVLHHH